MPQFFLFGPKMLSPAPIGFEQFIDITHGLSISSGAANAPTSTGSDFIELGLSRTFNLRIEAGSGDVIVSLIPTLNDGDFPPVRVELIGEGETVTAELLEHRLYNLRQVYAIALLVQEGREEALSEVLRGNSSADIEKALISREDKLLIQEATPGSLILSILATTKKTYTAILYACSVPFSEGRLALMGRVNAATALAELEVKAKGQDIKLKRAQGIIGLAKEIDKIKDEGTRELIRARLFENMSNLSSNTNTTPAIPHSQTVGMPLSATPKDHEADLIGEDKWEKGKGTRHKSKGRRR